MTPNIHSVVDGSDGPWVVFANSLGTDLRIWDEVVVRLPSGIRILRYDMRGHGQSDVPPTPYSMGAMIADAETLLDHNGVKDCVFVGLSIGGMVAQGLAVKRLDLIRGMVLSNTSTKSGQASMWHDRIEAVKTGGLHSIADAVMQRWFGRDMLRSPDLPRWRKMLTDTPKEGYMGACAAIAGTDFYTPTSGLRLPTLGIAGSEDGAMPPDMVRETTALIPGSQFHLIRRAGHLPCVDAPEEYAATLTKFMRDIGHIPAT